MYVHVIINPAAGGDSPILNRINDVFHPVGQRWNVDVTNEPGDGTRFAREAVARGADIVALYGGDGLVMEVANGLAGSGVPMAILPGGTANVMSVELNIPSDLTAACQLILDERHLLQTVDLGELAGHGAFVLRIGLGLEAEMVQNADREFKERFGSLAYALSALNALREGAVSRYQITVDGESFESEGLTCLICNSGSLGQGNFKIAPTISVSDGLLDVIVLRRAALGSLVDMINQVVRGDESSNETFDHWQGRTIEVVADPPQTVQFDGELIEIERLSVSVVPGALQIIVPAATSPDDEVMVELSDVSETLADDQEL